MHRLVPRPCLLADGHSVGFTHDATALSYGHNDGYSIHYLNGVKLVQSLAFGANKEIVVVEKQGKLTVSVSSYNPTILNCYKDRTLVSRLKCKENILTVKLNCKRMVICTERSLLIHCLPALQKMHEITGMPSNPRGIVDLCASDASVLAYPIFDGTGAVNLYDADTMRASHHINAHESEIAALKLNYDGSMLATASEKGTVIRVYSTRNSADVMFEFTRGTVKNANIYSLAFSKDSAYLASSGSTGTVHLYRLDEPLNANAPNDTFTEMCTNYVWTQVKNVVPAVVRPKSIARCHVPGVQDYENRVALKEIDNHLHLLIVTKEAYFYAFKYNFHENNFELQSQKHLNPDPDAFIKKHEEPRNRRRSSTSYVNPNVLEPFEADEELFGEIPGSRKVPLRSRVIVEIEKLEVVDHDEGRERVSTDEMIPVEIQPSCDDVVSKSSGSSKTGMMYPDLSDLSEEEDIMHPLSYQNPISRNLENSDQPMPIQKTQTTSDDDEEEEDMMHHPLSSQNLEKPEQTIPSLPSTSIQKLQAMSSPASKLAQPLPSAPPASLDDVQKPKYEKNEVVKTPIMVDHTLEVKKETKITLEKKELLATSPRPVEEVKCAKPVQSKLIQMPEPSETNQWPTDSIRTAQSVNVPLGEKKYSGSASTQISDTNTPKVQSNVAVVVEKNVLTEQLRGVVATTTDGWKSTVVSAAESQAAVLPISDQNPIFASITSFQSKDPLPPAQIMPATPNQPSLAAHMDYPKASAQPKLALPTLSPMKTKSEEKPKAEESKFTSQMLKPASSSPSVAKDKDSSVKSENSPAKPLSAPQKTEIPELRAKTTPSETTIASSQRIEKSFNSQSPLKPQTPVLVSEKKDDGKLKYGKLSEEVEPESDSDALPVVPPRILKNSAQASSDQPITAVSSPQKDRYRSSECASFTVSSPVKATAPPQRPETSELVLANKDSAVKSESRPPKPLSSSQKSDIPSLKTQEIAPKVESSRMSANRPPSKPLFLPNFAPMKTPPKQEPVSAEAPKPVQTRIVKGLNLSEAFKHEKENPGLLSLSSDASLSSNSESSVMKKSRKSLKKESPRPKHSCTSSEDDPAPQKTTPRRILCKSPTAAPPKSSASSQPASSTSPATALDPFEIPDFARNACIPNSSDDEFSDSVPVVDDMTIELHNSPLKPLAPNPLVKPTPFTLKSNIDELSSDSESESSSLSEKKAKSKKVDAQRPQKIESIRMQPDMESSDNVSADVLLLRDCATVADWFQVFLCVTSVIVFAFGISVFQKILNVIFGLIYGETGRKMRALKSELLVLKKEMSTMSQVNDFAKYFKKERMANKLTEQIAEMESQQAKEGAARKVFVVTLSQILTSVIGLTCMWSSAEVKVFRFYSSNTCWPICFVMDMPRGAGKLLGWSGYYDTDSFMSLFVFLNVSVAAIRRLPELRRLACRTEVMVEESKNKSE